LVPNPEENAMKTLSRFLAKFISLIVAVLSCFDRVIFTRSLASGRATFSRTLALGSSSQKTGSSSPSALSSIGVSVTRCCGPS